MSFRRLLTRGERVVVEMRPHWAFLGWPLVLSVLFLAGATALWVAVPGAPVWVFYVVLAVVALPLLWLAGRGARWLSTSLVITNLRLVERSGVLGRRALEIRLERINELSYHQSLLGRLVRAGEVTVETGGEAGVVVFDHVRRPAVVQSVITEQLAIFRHGGDPGVPPSGPAPASGSETPPAGVPVVPVGPAAGGGPVSGAGATIAERLMQLDELHQRGLVSDGEYEAKRRELLGSL